MTPRSNGTVEKLRNLSCPYCGRVFDCDSLQATVEHVIAKRFVPKGALDGSFNLLLQACEECNNQKSQFEGEVSAITLQPDVAGRLAEQDPMLASEALRKGAGAQSSLTGKPVDQSDAEFIASGEREGHLSINVRGPTGDLAFFKGQATLSIALRFVGPPQLPGPVGVALANMHVRAFVYWLSYDPGRQLGGLISHVLVDQLVPRSDWGNSRMMAFQDQISRGWEQGYAHSSSAARGFFRVRLQELADLPVIAWALEWNKNYRVVGYCGEEDHCKAAAGLLPDLARQVVSKEGDEQWRSRLEAPLAESDDRLFPST
ncbi:MAG: HNH endonuclease signature motif containing protein [Phycisphaeraceae bacterium]